ncbi:MAG: hypothetical protein KF873_17470 [Gemmataceae bacterium]|nr:hypothetical protein [Gemmataceae bacterium]
MWRYRFVNATPALVVVLAGLLTPVSSHGAERYFLIMMSSQRSPKNPNFSHTFATFVRVDPAAPGTMETRTISWMPCTGTVRVQALRPECGRNYGLHETVEWALQSEQRVSIWGPYEIEPELYHRADRRFEELERGTIRYKTYDGFHHSERVSNCIHAVSTINHRHRLRIASPGWGDLASFIVLETMMPSIVDRRRTHDWLIPLLKLDRYPIAYRKALPRSVLAVSSGIPLFVRDARPFVSYGPPPVRGR